MCSRMRRQHSCLEILWKFRFTVIPLRAIISLQTFAHVTTVQLSCHEHNFTAIAFLEFEESKRKFSVNLNGHEIIQHVPQNKTKFLSNLITMKMSLVKWTLYIYIYIYVFTQDFVITTDILLLYKHTHMFNKDGSQWCVVHIFQEITHVRDCINMTDTWHG